MMDFPSTLEQVMHSRNFHIRGKINYSITGKFQRFRNANAYKGGKDLFVVLHDYDRGATFGDWHYQEDWFTYWHNATGKPTIQELKERKIALEKSKQIQELDRAHCERRAQEFFNKPYANTPSLNHLYIASKKIYPYLAKQIRSSLVIPVSNIYQQLCSVQIIKPNGFKKLWTGTSQKERMIWISDVIPRNYSGVIRICEGYATGCTIYQITQSPVICAINAHNLTPIAIEVKQKYINAIVKICADNDQWGKENTGMAHASFACRQTGASLQYPVFDGLNIDNKPTDFNDLFVLTDRETVKKQLVIIRR